MKLAKISKLICKLHSFQVLQLIYFIMAFINDFIESKDTNTNQRTRFTRIKDFIFSALVFPVACDVGVMFWIFYFINPVLIASSEQHELVPAWFCHMLRTHIVIFVVFEIILIHRIYPCHLDALLALLTFILTYLAWTLIVYLETDEWIYPVMEKFNWPQRIGFFGLNVFAPVTFYVVGDLLNNLAWTSKLKQRRISNVPRESTSCIDSNDRTLTITNITEV